MEKEMILNLKNYIKELNKEQKSDKLQRKTDRLPEGFVRIKPADLAAEDVRSRKEALRMLYKIYEEWREKETTADPNFETWLSEGWGRRSRYTQLKSGLWDRFAKNIKQEA